VLKINIPVHVYECEDCILVFAVEMAFEDQSVICCPSCGTEEINDVADGELIINRGHQKKAKLL
jgi:predicted nucleic acid-binding Zn ribbon protein